MEKFTSQLDAVASPTPRARMGSGKISPMTVQPVGPHVQAKKLIKIQVKTIRTICAALPES